RLELPPPGLKNVDPFPIKLRTADCVGYRRREILVDGALLKTCEGDGTVCEFTKPDGFPGKERIWVTGRVFPLVGPMELVLAEYVFAKDAPKVDTIAVDFHSRPVIEDIDTTIKTPSGTTTPPHRAD